MWQRSRVNLGICASRWQEVWRVPGGSCNVTWRNEEQGGRFVPVPQIKEDGLQLMLERVHNRTRGPDQGGRFATCTTGARAESRDLHWESVIIVITSGQTAAWLSNIRTKTTTQSPNRCCLSIDRPHV